MHCWGANGGGQLGDGTTSDSTVPVLVTGGHSWASLGNPCGVTTGGEAYCWGSNNLGQLGDGTTMSRNTPTLVIGGMTWMLVTGAGPHTCAVMIFDEAYCWGWNVQGQLGNGTTSGYYMANPIPALVTGGYRWTSITVGDRHTCGVTTTGEAYCWGYNSNNQLLGDGTTTNRYVPTKVGGSW